MICEWCGNPDAEYAVTLPEECCGFYICGDCVQAGQERGGGTAFCHNCSKTIRIRDADAETEQWKSSRWRRPVTVTRYVCNGGCDSLE